MRKEIVLVCLFVASAFGTFAGNEYLTSPDTVVTGAFIPKEIEDIECLGINKEPAHATHMPYANLKEALQANRHKSTLCQSLNGNRKFNYVAWPQPVSYTHLRAHETRHA